MSNVTQLPIKPQPTKKPHDVKFVLDVIFQALRRYDIPQINDVTHDSDGDVFLTLEDSSGRMSEWAINKHGIQEAGPV